MVDRGWSSKVAWGDHVGGGVSAEDC